MAKNKKSRNSSKIPRESRGMVNIVSNPIWKAFAKNPLPDASQAKFGASSRLAFYKLESGDGGVQECCELIAATHATLVLCERGYGPEYLPVVNDALLALKRRRDLIRVAAHGVFDSAEAEAIREMLSIYQAQSESVGKAEFAAALVQAYQRATSPHENASLPSISP